MPHGINPCRLQLLFVDLNLTDLPPVSDGAEELSGRIASIAVGGLSGWRI
jgi:hypothetical protein